MAAWYIVDSEPGVARGLQVLCRLAYGAAGVEDARTRATELTARRSSAGLLRGLPRVGVFRQVPVLMRSWLA